MVAYRQASNKPTKFSSEATCTTYFALAQRFIELYIFPLDGLHVAQVYRLMYMARFACFSSKWLSPGAGRPCDPNTIAAALAIHRDMLCGKSVSVVHVYRVLFRTSPPEENSPDDEKDIAWLARDVVYDHISFDRIKALAKEKYRRVRARQGELQVTNDIGDLFHAGIAVYNEGDYGPTEEEVMGGMYDIEHDGSEAESEPSNL